MAKPFDATLNLLIDIAPDDWAACFARLAGIPAGPSVAVDTDLAITLQADKIFRIDGPKPSLLHLELEANPRLGIPRELMRYNTLVDHQHDLPVRTVLVLLRPKALASDMTGRYVRSAVDGSTIEEFHYVVERVWERPVDFWLESGIGLAPLALLTDEAESNLEGALNRFRESTRDRRIGAKLTATLLSSSFVLCGLRYETERVAEIFGRLSMLLEESTTYQWILEKGEAQGLRKVLLEIGAERLGPPPEQIASTIQGISDSAHLRQLLKRLFAVTGWNELLTEE